MTCPACAHENRPGAKFCEECAAPLRRACAGCGAELRPTAKFCDECGAPTGTAPRPTAPPHATAAEPADTRKVVTILFGDLVGSTALHERIDAESVRLFMESYYAAMRGAVEAHGGRVTQVMGDGVKAVFGAPRVAEDDAIRAVRAGVAMQDAFRALAEQQRGRVGTTGLRVAVNTGEVVANDATEIIGDPVNVAARLQEQGRDGDVVIGESTHRLVSTLVTLELLGSFALKGRSEAVKAYRVVSLDRPAGAATAPFVGREEELARLTAVYTTAVEKPAAGLAVLVGSPGLGKSRLIDEFARRHADAATVVLAHCDAAGGATFAPLADALRALLGIESGASAETLRATIESALPAEAADRARIASGIAALLAGAPPSPEETFFVVRRLLGALARAKPVVLVIDDLHWAEPLLLDLVEHLIQWGSGVPLLVLIGARPELRDLRSSLVTPGGFVADVVTLSGLDAGAAMRLAANVIGAADLPAAIAAKVLATSEGNPLFVGELVRMLVQEGALRREGDRWTAGANLAALEMPPTIHALLAARIERLRPEERTVLERAAVVGRHFSRSAVAALLLQTGDLDARLEALRRSELIERDTGWLLGEPVLRFHHVLIRDAAYRRLLKGTRAELHATLADWIEAQVGDAPEHDETIGWHLEQAHAFLRELGPLDASGQRLGERAATRLAAAGRRALARDDLAVAGDLLGRAIDRLDADDPARADLSLDWCEALLAAGDVGTAAKAIEELGRFAGKEAAGRSAVTRSGEETTGDVLPLTANLPTANRLSSWHTCFVGQHTVLTAPSALHETTGAVAAAADALTAQGDAAGEAKAHYVHALALSRLGKVGACEAALDRALAAARRAGDRRRANTVLAIAPLAALWGPSPVTRASGRCLDVVRVLRITQGAPAVEAVALSCQGVLEALRGRTEAARRMIASARKMVEELGITQRLLEADVAGGLVALLEDDAIAAERSLRGAYDGLRDLGLGIDAARAAALLARALLAQGRADEAEALSHESEALAGDDLKAAIAWRGVRAEALARRGKHGEAIALATRAVELAAATDALLDHADARIALAAALRAAGRAGDADAEERRARELWQAKGATLLAERAAPAEAPVAPPVAAPVHAPRRRPVRPNHAFEEMRRAEAAVAAGDARALETLYRRDVEIVDHQFGITYGYAEIVERVRAIIEDSTESAFAHEPLASLGDSLALCRMRSTASGSTAHGISIGATEVPYLLVIEADEMGSARYIEIFGDDKLADAVVRLYERHAAQQPEGSGRARAAAVAHAAIAVMRPIDLDRMAAAFAPDLRMTDHRVPATWSAESGAELVEHFRRHLDLAPDFAPRIDDVLVLEPRALLARITYVGTARDSGGPFGNQTCVLFVFGDDGRVSQIDCFEAKHAAEALARFDALAERSPETPAEPFDNTASRADRSLFERFNARDWSGIEALAAPDLVFDERRRLLHNTCGREVWLEQFRVLFDVPASRFTTKPLATRGERLALSLHRFEGEVAGGGGPLAIDDHLVLHEVDRHGRIVAIVLFDLEDEDAAYTELDARHDASEAELHPRVTAVRMAQPRPYLERDWDAFAAMYAPDVVCHDHRLLGWGTLRGVDGWMRTQQALVELAPDTRVRNKHVAAAEHGFLVSALISGTRDGGAFELAFLRVSEIDAAGKLCRLDLYDVGDADAALARFAELAAPAETAPGRFENAASRAWRAVNEAWGARDLECFAAPHAADLRYRDHRRLFQLDLDRAGFLDFTRPLLTMRAGDASLDLVATRGERLALMHSVMTMEDETVGPSTIESLMLIETDEHGAITAYDRWDLEDSEAACAEIEARWRAGGGGLNYGQRALRDFGAALERRDWDAVSACFTSEFVGDDHRLVGWGTVHGPAELVRTLQEIVALAPDARMRSNHRRVGVRAAIHDLTWFGTRDGGAFEISFVNVTEHDADGRIVRVDFYDPHHLDRALARFEGIRASERRDLLAAIAKPNAASAALDRWQAAYDAAFETGDWDPMRALCAPEVVFDDRRRLFLISGDLDFFIASARERAAVGARPLLTPFGTAGDRIAIQRMLWSGGPAGGRFEIAYVFVGECDESGLLTAIVLFDPDDPRAAQREAWARWAAIDPAVALWVELLDAITAGWNARDRAALLARFADDVVVVAHRLTGIGRIEGAAAYVDANAVLWDLAPDQRIEFSSSFLAFDRHGFVVTLRRAGTLADGGAFESKYVWVSLVVGGRITRLELFEIGAQDEALACFEELRPDPLRVPPNAASRAIDRTAPLLASGGLDALRSLVTDDFCLDDRTRRAQLRGGVEEGLRGLDFLRTEMRGHLHTRLLATAGDRLALRHAAWRETPGESSFLIERLNVSEVDAAGKLRAFVIFDADDRAAALAELFDRYVALGAEGMPACLVEFKGALDSRDLSRARAVLADDFVYHDRRRTGAGRLDGPDPYLASPRAWWELSDDARIDMLYSVAVAPHGRVAVNRMAGRNLEGGEFESFMVTVLWTRGDRLAGIENFEIDQLDAALARLEELRTDPLPIPPTAATRVRDRQRDAFDARDWDAMRVLAGADFVYDDRGKRALVRGDVEAWIATMEFTTHPGFRSESTLIGTLADRIVLDHVRWFGKPGGDAFEFERVRLLEVGADGLLRAVVFFDPEDRFAASVEGLARFAAGEAAGNAGIAPMLVFSRALDDRDWEAARDCFAPAAALVDHRPLSFGALDRDQWIAALRANDELSVGLTWDVFRVLAWDERGFVVGIRRLGNIAGGGGPYENEFFAVALVADGRFQRYEIFGEADAERAVARFEELCAAAAGAG